MNKQSAESPALIPARARLLLPALALGMGAVRSHAKPRVEEGDDVERRSTRNTVALLGSSTAFGAGASAYDLSLAGRLAAALARIGMRLENRSVVGSTTRASLDRFSRDVEPLRPGFVVLATSIFNEGVPTEPGVVERYLDNTHQLVDACEAVGAAAVILGPYPNSGTWPAVRARILEAYAQLESEGVPVIDTYSATEDGQGHWLPGLSADSVHPNNSGHAVLFEAVSLSTFLSRGRVLFPGRLPLAAGSWNCDAAGESVLRVEAVPAAGPAPSWCVSCWCKLPDGAGKIRLMSAAGLDLVAGDSEVVLSSPDSILARAPLEIRPVWTHLALRAKAVANTLTLYVNGSAVLTAAPARDLALHQVALSPRMLGEPAAARMVAYSNLSVHRSPLSLEDIRRLSELRPTAKSLENWLPMASAPDRAPRDYAYGEAGVTVSGAWRWNEDSPERRTRAATA